MMKIWQKLYVHLCLVVANGLTEMQEHEFYEQPVKCKLETKEVVKIVTTIVLEE